MPAGVPVGTLAIGKAGAANAGLLAAAILANGDAALAERLEAWREQQTTERGRPARMTIRRAPPSASSAAGQLGRMLAMAAAQLGYKCHVYAPDADPPAAEVAARFTQGEFDDEAALQRFAREVDVATYEFENIAAGPLAALTADVAAAAAARGAAGRAGPARGERVHRRAGRPAGAVRSGRQRPRSWRRRWPRSAAGRPQDPAARL